MVEQTGQTWGQPVRSGQLNLHDSAVVHVLGSAHVPPPAIQTERVVREIECAWNILVCMAMLLLKGSLIYTVTKDSIDSV